MASVPTLDLSGLSDTERAYIAGFVDGEGTITVVPVKTQARRKSYYSIFTIVNTHLETMNHLAAMMGCSVMTHKREGGNWKTVYKIVVRSTADVLHVIEVIYPYLITKRRQADLAMKFCRRKLAKYGDGDYSDTFAEDLLLSEEIRRLNKRGPDGTPQSRAEHLGVSP